MRESTLPEGAGGMQSFATHRLRRGATNSRQPVHSRPHNTIAMLAVPLSLRTHAAKACLTLRLAWSSPLWAWPVRAVDSADPWNKKPRPKKFVHVSLQLRWLVALYLPARSIRKARQEKKGRSATV